MVLDHIDALEALVESVLHKARIPGAAIVVVGRHGAIFSKGYGFRDLGRRLPLTPRTKYPIASTTKAITATLLASLVEEGTLAWDLPVQNYLPHFRLCDVATSAQVTLRDLFAMRTGLPRHDWLWWGNPMKRVDLLGKIRHLELSSGFRERFQYNNLLITVAGHVAEVVTGKDWAALVRERVLIPLCMDSTVFSVSETDEVTGFFHESHRRELVQTRKLFSEMTGPSGGAIYSTVDDMARWAAFNLNACTEVRPGVVSAKMLLQLHSPQMIVGQDSTATSPNAAYAMGWFVDTYHGSHRVAHGGYLHDVSSDVALFPTEGVGIVSFINFGCPLPARAINEWIVDVISGRDCGSSIDAKLVQYENKIAETRARISESRRVSHTSPSHALGDYAGTYVHPGYGGVVVANTGCELIFRRHDRESLILPLEHWHYDVWVAKEHDYLPIHETNPFDPTGRLVFETNADGEIAALLIRLEPTVGPIRFEKQNLRRSE